MKFDHNVLILTSVIIAVLLNLILPLLIRPLIPERVLNVNHDDSNDTIIDSFVKMLVHHEKNKLLNVFRHVHVMGNRLVYKQVKDTYPFVMGTQSSLNGYLDNKRLLKLTYPSRPIENEIVKNMLTVNQAMALSKAYNKL